MTLRSRWFVVAALVAVAVLVAAVWPDSAQPVRHVLRNAIRQVF